MSPRPRFTALPARLALLLALVLALPACDSSGPPPSTDEIFFGLNYTRLFAPATAAEISTVKTEWAARNTTSSAEAIVAETTIDGARVAIIVYDATATGCGTVTNYAAVRIPSGLVGAAPLLVVHHGGDSGFNVGVGTGTSDQTANTSLVRMVAAFPDLFAQTVQVLPVYRSEELRTTGYAALGDPYVAGGTESPWDCDVDDAIASVQAATALFPAAIDATRRAAMGFSRGGNTAALHAIRDPQMTALVDYYGPTDFFNPGAQLLASGVLGGSSTALGLPGATYIRDAVLRPLIGPGGTYNPDADYATARLEVVRRSASAFTPDLPDTQVHHHYRDGTVPYAFSAAFQAAATARGTGGTFELFSYGTPTTPGDTGTDGSFHAPEANPESLPRVQTFLRSALGAARPAPARALVLAY